MDKPSSEYISQEVEGASPVRLVELLYQRALSDLEAARELWPDERRMPEAIRAALHAQLILRELHSSLNRNEGGELAEHLSRLYEFMQFTLHNLITQPQPDAPSRLQDMIDLLQPISESWSKMARENSNSDVHERIGDGSLVA